MGQTVYVDLLFLINFSMDFLCFFLSSKLLGKKLSVWRAGIASILGGIYASAVLFWSVGRIAALGVDLAACAVICAVAFYERGRAKSLPFYILVYFAISMALGGFMTALFNLLNKAELPLEQGASDGLSVWVFAVLAAASGVITLLGGRLLGRRAVQKNANIVISYAGKSVRLRGMSDSGNLLREPISGRVCIFVDMMSLKPILPPRVYDAAKKKDAGAVGRLSPEDAARIRVVPIRTAGGEGMLLALRADRVAIDCGKGETEIDALIAISDIASSADGNEALIPAELFI